MKMNKYIGLAAMAVAFTACQQDMLEGENMQNGIYTLSGKMSGGAAMSRAQIQLGNTDASIGEIFYWNEGDSFTLYQGDNDNYTEHVFSIKDYSEEGDNKKNTASFVTDNPALPGEIIAVYPSGMKMDYDQEIMKVGMDFQTELDFSQGTVEEVWKDYFKNNMVMKAKATLSDGANNSLQFEHLTSLARITYTNQSGKDQNVTDIILGGDQTFGFSKTVWFKYDIIGGNSSNGYQINYKNLTVKAGESFDFYILFGPNDFREGDMHIHIHTAETDVNRSPLALPTSTIAAANNGAKGFEAGKRYWFKVTETESGLAWSKEVTVGPTIEEVAKNGGTFTITENTRLTTPLVVESDMTLSIEDGWLGGTSGDEFLDPDNLKTLIAVKPGATLTLEGNNQFNTGHVLEQLSCIRMLGGSDEASKVVINDGTIIGTYYAIVVDEDCQNAEVEINGGSLSCDWNKEFNGSAILNKGNAKVNINSGHISSCGSAVEMWGGQFTMSGGTLQSSFEGEKSYVDTNGVTENCIVGSALALYPAANKTITATISGGTFEGLSSIYEIRSNETGSVSLSVIGGKFEGTINSYNCTAFISGGQFKVQPDVNYMFSGRTTVLNGDYYEVQDGESTSELITIQNTELSTALQAVLGVDKVSLNTDSCAVMNKADVEAVTALDFNGKGYTITSLAGIENFVNLDDLRCNSVGLVSCDLSKNKALKVLMLSSNPLEGVLDLSNNAKLEVLYLQGTDKVTSVKLDNCTNLGFVCLTSTRSLTSFEIPNKAGVYFLDYSSSSLNFNLSEFTGLTTLKCSFKGLTELNLSDEAKSKLTFIECSGNNLGDLDLSGYTSLETFSGFNAGITSLNVSEAVNLKKLWCFQNNMQNLDITFLSNLEEVRCGRQLNDAVLQLNLTETQNTIWETTWSTDAYNANVILKVETTVTIQNTELSTALKTVLGAENVTLDTNGYAVMTKSFAESVLELNLNQMSLTSLSGIAVFKNLTVLDCEENALTALDLAELPNLKNLNCVNNQLTSLDLSYCPELTSLRCAKNQLASISVNHLKNLVDLDIIDNQLTSLDVSSLTNLMALCCFGNHLTTLDLTACVALSTMQLGTQTDKDGQDITLKLKLSDASMESWTSKWASDGSNKNVELVTDSSVNTGSGNTGGSDFTIEGIY